MPPFSGFWSKDEILLFAFDKSPVLWAVGLVTALLTAYYMTRQVIMVFYGKARWNDDAAEHGAHGDMHPHESPWLMVLPLVRARRPGASSAARSTCRSTTRPRSSPSGSSRSYGAGVERILDGSTEDIKWVLAGVATVGAIVGIALACWCTRSGS